MGVTRDGKVDAWEVVSDSDNPDDLLERLRNAMNSLPKDARGTYDLIYPGE
jgi:hypothetical protein